jgi:integrase
MEMKGLRPDSVASYRQRLGWWLDRCGSVPPSRWTRGLLERTLAEQTTWGPRSKALLVAALRRMRRWAQRAGVFLPDLTAGVELPPYRPAPRVPLTAAEVDRLMAAATGHAYAPAVALAAYAGLSLGDLRTLTWGEVDLEAGWIVRRTGRQKTGVPLRVPILPALGTALRSIRPLHPAPDAVVCSRLPRTRRSLYRTLQRLYAQAGIERPKGSAWHLLRHSFGTLLMRAGVPSAVIGRLLSHQPGSVVTARYQHPDDRDLVAALEALGSHLRTTPVTG